MWNHWKKAGVLTHIGYHFIGSHLVIWPIHDPTQYYCNFEITHQIDTTIISDQSSKLSFFSEVHRTTNLGSRIFSQYRCHPSSQLHNCKFVAWILDEKNSGIPPSLLDWRFSGLMTALAPKKSSHFFLKCFYHPSSTQLALEIHVYTSVSTCEISCYWWWSNPMSDNHLVNMFFHFFPVFLLMICNQRFLNTTRH